MSTASRLARPLRVALVVATLVVPLAVLTAAPDARPRLQAADPLRFAVSFAERSRREAVTGRVYVAISRDNQRPPIEQSGPTGAPLFGVNVENLKAGDSAIIDAGTFGHPLQSLKDLPAGDYRVQPFVNVYTKFARADGTTVWLHMDQWEGQNWKRSPGNLYGDPVQLTLDPSSSGTVTLVADKVIPPVDVTPDTDGMCTIGLYNEKLALAVATRYKKRQLPALANWQHWGPGEYVTGLEPGTNPPIGQAKAREQKKLLHLDPGQSRTYDLEIRVLTQEQDIRRFLKAAGQ